MSANHKSEIPLHIGIILDGNRRWAKASGLPTLEGHRKGYDNLKTIAKAAFNSGVKYLSAFVFSTENWNRSREEVDYLMKLLLWVAKNEVSELDKENIRVIVLGSRDKLEPKIVKAIEEAQAKTENNTKGTLCLCLNYGGHQEIVDAVKTIVKSGTKPDQISAETITKNLYHPNVPPVDLVIRTSGEQRLSNFMLWRSAYAELYFTDTFWPDFKEADLKKAITEYQNRHRRFGR